MIVYWLMAASAGSMLRAIYVAGLVSLDRRTLEKFRHEYLVIAVR